MILGDPKNPEYLGMRGWLGLRKMKQFDAFSFDLEKANKKCG
jgi:hypothetical protein